MDSLAGFERSLALELLDSSDARRKYLTRSFLKGLGFGLVLALVLSFCFDDAWFGGIERMLLTVPGLKQLAKICLFGSFFWGAVSLAAHRESVSNLLQTKRSAAAYQRFMDP